jgi:hypothetical protein
MTLQELENTLPNGFHDAEISKLEVDYAARTARLHLALLVGLPDEPAPQRDRMAPALLELTGLLYVVTERPDPRYPYDNPEPISATGLCDLDPPSELPPGAYGSRLFIVNWNAFMHLAARDAKLTWLPEEGSSRSSARPTYLPGEAVRFDL